jgi:plastocyanin
MATGGRTPVQELTPMSRLTVIAVLAVLVLAACTEQEPDITLEDQVPADQQEAAAEAAEEENGEEPAENGEEPAENGEEPATNGEAVAIEAGDLFFEGFPETLPAGTVEFEMNNVGNLPHDITVEELGDQEVVHTDGGETATGTVELEAGEYTFYCSIPGHRANMEETVTVE